jgi:UDPglucose 6-dehydrogenase
VAESARSAAGGSLAGSVVAAWGLTFKAGTDDLRESPAISVLRRIRDLGGAVRAYDPTLPDPESWDLADLHIGVCDDPYLACCGASVLIVLTEWPEFRDIDLAKAAGVMLRPSVVDTRNMLDPGMARSAGFHYVGMGRS